MSEINVLQEAVDALLPTLPNEPGKMWDPKHRPEAESLALKWLECKQYVVEHQIIGQIEIEWIERHLSNWQSFHHQAGAYRIVTRQAIEFLGDTNRRRQNLDLRKYLANLATPAVQ